MAKGDTSLLCLKLGLIDFRKVLFCAMPYEMFRCLIVCIMTEPCLTTFLYFVVNKIIESNPIYYHFFYLIAVLKVLPTSTLM